MKKEVGLIILNVHCNLFYPVLIESEQLQTKQFQRVFNELMRKTPAQVHVRNTHHTLLLRYCCSVLKAFSNAIAEMYDVEILKFVTG